MRIRKKSFIQGVLYLLVAMAFFVSPEVMAALGKGGSNFADGSIGTVAENMQSSFSAVAKLVTAGSYLGGIVFVIFAIVKFKNHKDNPTQVPIGGPIMMLFIGAALLFLPSVMKTAGLTVFGSQASAGGVDGIDSFDYN